MNKEQEVRADKTNTTWLQNTDERRTSTTIIIRLSPSPVGFCNPRGFSNQSMERMWLVLIINPNRPTYSKYGFTSLASQVN
jgi:hypothetical protein